MAAKPTPPKPLPKIADGSLYESGRVVLVDGRHGRALYCRPATPLELTIDPAHYRVRVLVDANPRPYGVTVPPAKIERLRR